MQVKGSCHCGEIRYEATIDPNQIGVCHCTDCQIFSGSAFRTSVIVPAARFSLLEGEPQIYEKTAESGAARYLAFCPRCGTHLYGVGGDERRRVYSVRTGTLEQRSELAPAVQLWTRSALSWIHDLESIRALEKQ